MEAQLRGRIVEEALRLRTEVQNFQWKWGPKDQFAEMFPEDLEGACALVSIMLARKLSYEGIYPSYCLSQNGEHVFLRVYTEIVDATATQFSTSTTRFPAVVIGELSELKRLFPRKGILWSPAKIFSSEAGLLAAISEWPSFQRNVGLVPKILRKVHDGIRPGP